MSLTTLEIVAIAGNLALVLVNVMLYQKIQRWHRQLRRQRQVFRQQEQQVQGMAAHLLQQTKVMGAAQQQVRVKKQQLEAVVAQVKLLQQLLGALKFITIGTR